MALPLRDLKTEARNLARAGQFAAALAAYDQMLAANPLDGDSRRKIGDLLFQLGDQAGAVEVFRTVAMHDIRSGHLLPALVGGKVLESLGQNIVELVSAMARSFAHGAPTLAKFAARQAPVDLDAPIEPPAPAASADLAKLVPRARARALDLSVFVQYPEQFLPVAFFSELPPSCFRPPCGCAPPPRPRRRGGVPRGGSRGPASTSWPRARFGWWPGGSRWSADRPARSS